VQKDYNKTLSNTKEFNPRRNAFKDALSIFLVVSFIAFIGIGILIVEDFSAAWLITSLLIAIAITVCITTAVWRQKLRRETEKSEWENEHPVIIRSEQFAVYPPSDVSRWHYLEHEDGSGWAQIVFGSVFVAFLGFVVFINSTSIPPLPIVVIPASILLVSILIVYTGLVRLLVYRSLEMRITSTKLTPGEKVRVVVRQPGRRRVANLQVALVNLLRDYRGDGSTYETLVAAPILESTKLIPAADGRILDLEFEIPNDWPRNENFAKFPIYSEIITVIRLKQDGPWPGCSYHFPVQIIEPAPSVLDLDWPSGDLQSRINREKKPSRPAVKATLNAIAVFIFTAFLATIIFMIITYSMPKDPSGLVLTIWFLIFQGYLLSLTVIPYKAWRKSYRKALKEWKAINQKL